MRVPMRWLAELVPNLPGAGDLAVRFDLAGLETTGRDEFGGPASELAWAPALVVVARVISIEKHPQADKLKMVTLDYGNPTGPKTVITGAPNIAVGESGQLVVLGLAGCRYYALDKNNNKTIATLVPKELRGIMNDAMCMSEYELGLSDDHDGIIILDEGDAAPGTPAFEVLGDAVLELDVLPNMARCLGLRGVALEAAALLGLSRKPLPLAELPPAGPAFVAIDLPDPVACPRYTATLIEGVGGRATPRLVRSRLRMMGQKPIRYLVDISNYVMFETAQPTHAFDYDVLQSRAGGGIPHIEVRYAKLGETLVTLDGAERNLTPEHLVVADAAGPVALAGVMGGRDTEVTPATRRVLLESAAFDPVAVRKTARAFNLFSEAATRFTRGVAPATVEVAARRFARLLGEHGAGRATGFAEAYPAPVSGRTAELRRSDIERLLGVPIPGADVERVLASLGYDLTPTAEGWRAAAPADRLDIQSGPADLVEDIVRVLGYDRVPGRLLPFELTPQRPDPAAELMDGVRDRLAELGFDEAVNYSLVSPESQSPFEPAGGAAARPVALVNPGSPERSVLRRHLLPGLLQAALHNAEKVSGAVRLFEAGPVYLARPGEALPDESPRLALVMAGARAGADFDRAPGDAALPPDFYGAKGVLAALFEALDIGGVAYSPNHSAPHLHPARSALLGAGGAAVGSVGELHPLLARSLKFKAAPVVAELNLAALLAAIPARVPFRPLSPYPPVEQDLAAVVPDATPAGEVGAAVREAGGELIESVRLFDVYKGEAVPAGSKSLAFAISYRLAARELTAKEVERAHGQIEAELRRRFGARIRGKDALGS